MALLGKADAETVHLLARLCCNLDLVQSVKQNNTLAAGCLAVQSSFSRAFAALLLADQAKVYTYVYQDLFIRTCIRAYSYVLAYCIFIRTCTHMY